eukprot:3833084-Rhodomonas_salina.5
MESWVRGHETEPCVPTCMKHEGILGMHGFQAAGTHLFLAQAVPGGGDVEGVHVFAADAARRRVVQRQRDLMHIARSGHCATSLIPGPQCTRRTPNAATI